MKKPTIRLPKQQIFKFASKILTMLGLAILTSFIFTIVYIALPQTENLFSNLVYNLHLKDDYWSKTFTLQTEETDDSKIKATSKVIENRLKAYGVEKYEISFGSVTKEEEDPEDSTKTVSKQYKTINITVQTTKIENNIKSLLASANNLKIVTRKTEVDFDSSDNQFAYLMPENYDETAFNRDSFRSFEVKKLRTSDTTTTSYSYFAIFKLWPTQESAFLKFLETYDGQEIGIEMDNFVQPYTVTASLGTIFFNVANDEESAKLTSIILNTDSFSSEMTLSDTDTKTNPVTNIDLDYMKVSIAYVCAVIIAGIGVLLLYRQNKTGIAKEINYIFTNFFIICLLVAYLKLTNTILDPESIIFVAVYGIILNLMLVINETNTSKIVICSTIVSLAGIVLGNYYLNETAVLALIVSIVAKPISIGFDTYINLMKKYLLKW